MVMICLVCIISLAAAACSPKGAETSGTSSSSKDKKPAPKSPVPVTADYAVLKDIPEELQAIGSVESYATVAIKARVTGELQKVHFREGQDVTKGDLLFTIDPRPLEAALREAVANLGKDKALLLKAEEDNRRYENLLQGGFISREQYDQVLSNLSAMQATVSADEAIVENAKIQLGYTAIYSPLSGRTGTLLINEGNMIKANDDNKDMVIIEQIQPVYVSFSVPEANLPPIMDRMKIRSLVVTTRPDGAASPETGILSFVDNSVDAKTGTIHLKATFDNKERRLWPGQFVNVALRLGMFQNSVTVPSQAVQIGENGRYVFVISSEKIAELRPVESGMSYGGETIIEKGLAAGDQVVTDGHLGLTPGSPVEISDHSKSETHPFRADSKEVQS